MSPSYEYECSLSGLTAPGDEPFDGDGLADMPVGWIELRMSRRVPNPRYMAIQQTKQAMMDSIIAQMASQMPPEAVEAQRLPVALQIDAQFILLEENTPPYLTDIETVYLAPPEMAPAVKKAVDQLRALVGLDALPATESEKK